MLFKNKKNNEPATDKQERINDGKTHIFNLIVLDASGSMSVIEDAARSGCNEVLSGIRKSQNDEPEMQQHVSLLPFSTGRMIYIYDNVSAENAQDIDKQYRPGGCTALYDAMGYSLTALEREVDKYTDAVGLVTIITDGYENASVEYSGKMIFDLVERLRAKGWTFSFMGANQDVLEVAKTLNIKNAREFDYSADGLHMAFATERSAKERYLHRMKQQRQEAADMSVEERQGYYASREEDTDYYGGI